MHLRFTGALVAAGLLALTACDSPGRPADTVLRSLPPSAGGHVDAALLTIRVLDVRAETGGGGDAVLTHAHFDHYGGMPYVVDELPVHLFAWNGQVRSSAYLAADTDATAPAWLASTTPEVAAVSAKHVVRREVRSPQPAAVPASSSNSAVSVRMSSRTVSTRATRS